jgi:hypothetical protein
MDDNSTKFKAFARRRRTATGDERWNRSDTGQRYNDSFMHAMAVPHALKNGFKSSLLSGRWSFDLYGKCVTVRGKDSLYPGEKRQKKAAKYNAVCATDEDVYRTD